MKNTRILFIILSVIWMILVFLFSNEPSSQSKNTSFFMTQKIAKIIYRDTLNKEELEEKEQKLDPIIRKIAHYTLYTVGGTIISLVVFSYDIDKKKKIAITQIIGSIYAITDELHQYFVPR